MEGWLLRKIKKRKQQLLSSNTKNNIGDEYVLKLVAFRKLRTFLEFLILLYNCTIENENELIDDVIRLNGSLILCHH